MASAHWLLGLFPHSRLRSTGSEVCQGQAQIFTQPAVSNMVQIGRFLAT